MRDLGTPSFICLQSNLKSWSDSKTSAEDKGGTLASIHCEQQNTQVKNMITSNSWIGGTDADVEGQWKWADGTEFEFTNWNSNEPNNLDGVQHCMQLYTFGKWDDLNCVDQKQAVYQSDSPIDGLTCQPYKRESFSFPFPI